MSGPPVDVLVAGAGPVGLTVALQAHALGARVRVVERRPRAFRPSRALIVHPRTLEALRPLGVVESLLDRAGAAPRAVLHTGRGVVLASLEDLGIRGTPYPYLTLVRQADVEAVLSGALAERGVTVERGTELTGYHPGLDSVSGEAVLHTSGRDERVRCRWVAGCDGTDSTVRGIAGIRRREAGYRQEILLADLALTGDLPPELLHVYAGRHGLCFLFPLGEGAHWRLLVTQPAGGPAAGSAHPDPDPTPGELQSALERSGVVARPAAVAWSTRLRLRYGVADRYRDGRLLLAGDAAHVHSPAGGLGMNVGLQDAVNLGWKLALAGRSSHPARLLDSYQAERRPAALRSLRLTNLIFHAESGLEPVAEFARGVLLPLAAPVLPAVLRRRRLVGEAVRLLGQLDASYRDSALSRAAPRRAGPWSPGDRLPDLPVEAGRRPVRLHELIARPGVHLLLDRGAPGIAGDGETVHVHRLGNAPGHGVTVVRPDGHVGACADRADDPAVAGWLATIGAPVAPPGSR
ncbi:FAD-dependent monooxygenase [Actinoplanes sp. NPDC020271]|uniref:FAD-dependent monooxygenase n=1 Tax=Actinoplanes sp. NPDC020271 TaxID=3363896 RepID=UPI0037BD9086